MCLWIQELKRSVLWTQNLTLLEDQGLWIQAIVLHCSYAKGASKSKVCGFKQLFFIFPMLRLHE